MGLFDGNENAQFQLNLSKQVFASLFVGVVLIVQKIDETHGEPINRHFITFANEAFAKRVSVFAPALIGREIHEFVPPSFRDVHRRILTTFFENPYRVAIEKRDTNQGNMMVVPFGADTEPDKWHNARIGINPLFVENSSEIVQFDNIKPALTVGMAEIFFADTFN